MTSKERITTRISPDILDTIGKSFKFKHAKGISEWLKNSLDHYLRLYDLGLESKDGSWPVLINLVDGTKEYPGPKMYVLDFGGTTLKYVEEFFLHWGDKSAASLGGTTFAAVTGGHGNGGKFYMREMWNDGARFLTWRDGLSTSLIVDKGKDGSTGFWEFRDRSITWSEALRYAISNNEGLGGANAILSYMDTNAPQIGRELENMTRGLTVIVGRDAKQINNSNDVVRSRNKWDPQRLIDEIRNAPQARRPIRELTISLFVNSELQIERLMPEKIEEDSDWPTIEINVPFGMIQNDTVKSAVDSVGQLWIRKSAVQLVGRQKHLNTLYVMDSNGNPIAFYPLNTLPLPGHSSITSFIQAEIILTFPEVAQLIENDREKLIDSPTTDSILKWIAENIWERIRAVEKAQYAKERNRELEIASILNKELNRHAKRFLEQLQSEVLVDYIDTSDGGGFGDEGDGISPFGKGNAGEGLRYVGKGGGIGAGGSKEVSGSTKSVRRLKFPEILLSGLDADPSREDGESKILTERHPPLEQDDVDKQFNIWWINTAHPFAKEAIKRGGAKGNAFKGYQLFMFRDVVQREGLRLIQRREAEMGLDIIENELSEISNRFLSELPYYLITELIGNE